MLPPRQGVQGERPHLHRIRDDRVGRWGSAVTSAYPAAASGVANARATNSAVDPDPGSTTAAGTPGVPYLIHMPVIVPAARVVR
jgi:hypothetical protein